MSQHWLPTATYRSLAALTFLGSSAYAFQAPFGEARRLPGTIELSNCLEAVDVLGGARLDVVMASTNSPLVYAAATQPDGTLAIPKVLFEAQGSVLDVVGGDLNGDGRDDLVVIAVDRTVGSYFRTGETWSAGPSSTLLAASPEFAEFQLVDVDGDGSLDLASTWSAAGNSRAEVALGAGDGSFAGFADAATAPLFGARHVFQDVDGDGDADLVTVGWADPGTGTYPALLTPNSGVFPLDAAAGQPVGAAAGAGRSWSDLAFADDDGDGDLDLFLLGYAGGASDVSLVPQASAGVFGGPQTVASLGATFAGLFAGDYDGDGAGDLVAVPEKGADRAYAFAALSRGATGFGAPELISAEEQIFGASLSVDLDGDGTSDIVHASAMRFELFPGFTKIEIELNRYSHGTGGLLELAEDSPVTLPSHFVYDVVSLADETPPALLASNFRFGQPLDFVLNEGRLQFGRTLPIPATITGEKHEFQDVSADGRADLLDFPDGSEGPTIRITASLGDGAGAFAAPADIFNWTMPAGGYAFNVHPVYEDLDGDGDLDIVVGITGDDGTGAFVALHLFAVNQGGGAFGAPFLLSDSLAPKSGGALLFGDVNADGFTDILFPVQGGFSAWRGVGGASFESAPTPVLSTTIDLGLRRGGLQDFTGDGVLDLLLVDQRDLEPLDDVYLAAGVGDGTFLAPTILVEARGRGMRMEVFDADGDGNKDVLTVSSSEPYVVFSKGVGQGAVAAPLVLPLPFRGNHVVVSDLDFDGDLDFVVSTAQLEPFINLLHPNYVFENLSLGELGEAYCPGVPNSTGRGGHTRAVGSTIITTNQLRLIADTLPPQSFGFFIASRTQGMVQTVPGSVGTLCLQGTIGRFVRPGEVQVSSAAGEFSLPVDLQSMPNPLGGPLAVQPGDEWNFQAWHRDSSPSGTPSSNFTSATSIVFQ